MKITPEMIKALAATIPNFHTMWEEYAKSDFRKEHLRNWAGNDPEKQQVVKELLDETC